MLYIVKKLNYGRVMIFNLLELDLFGKCFWPRKVQSKKGLLKMFSYRSKRSHIGGNCLIPPKILKD